ncbi:MAG: desulfoferrodoxin [Candidatus Woesearchaeota archaeon]|nr:MAG: desulfoferrodoxin [Candidatus Woesearchaeota archaeon]
MDIYQHKESKVVVELFDGETLADASWRNLPEIFLKDEGKEKHVPIVEIEGNKVIVNVGSIPHPMDEDHYIGFIQVLAGSQVLTQKLTPGDAPKAEFLVLDASDVKVRAYCNLHGLWVNKK